MRQGSLDVVSDHNVSGAGTVYRVLFYGFPSGGLAGSHGAVQQQQPIQGDDALRQFFINDLLLQDLPMKRREQMADEWLSVLVTKGTLSLSSVSISEDLFDWLTVK